MLAIIESNESLSSYHIRSLIPGRIIEKHITLGKFFSDETTVYKIANFSIVWINLAVYIKNLHIIKIGQKVDIESVGVHIRASGIISYIQPIFNEETRGFIARVVLPNRNNQFQPGMFVKGKIVLITGKSIPIISNNALQVIDEKPCVFVPEGKGVYRLVTFSIGEKGIHYSHLLSGLNIGDSYVGIGSFKFKAKFVMSNIGGHAGYGHQ
ncbi:MAG: efflux RND transporter periplasmic adaptor subunit [Spirochaetota bacterium]|nr:efflux RND transporter periplasmic adaptor subunit [Spirochaetota bacterium]